MLDTSMFGSRHMRLVRQSEIAECGLACLAMIAGYHGLSIDLVALRRSFSPSARGMSLRALMAVADQIGLTPRPVKLPMQALGDLHCPAILHWDHNHFVVLQSVAGRHAIIHDPAGSSTRLSLEEVANHFTGVALELRPSKRFKRGDRRERLSMDRLWETTSGLSTAIIQVALLSIVMTAYALAFPYYMQIAIDTVLPALDVSLLTVLAVGFGLFMLFNAGASLLRSFVVLTAGSTLGYSIGVNLGRKLFRLPIDWHERRPVGDVLTRFHSIQPIQEFLTKGAITAALDGAVGIVILFAMALYSPLLAGIALTAFAVYAVVRIATVRLQRAAAQAAIVEHGEEQTTMIDSLRGIQALRLAGRETFRHALWQNRLTDAVNADIRVARIGIWQHTANLIIFGAENVISIWLSVRMVIDGGFSIGMVIAYAAYKSQFVTRTVSLLDEWINYRMLALHLDRIADIVVSDEDASFSQQERADVFLQGQVELKGISYRYAPSEPLALENVDLTIESGEHVAITGPSGSGKTTLAKIILGLFQPETGEVLVDGERLSAFGIRNYRRQVAAVMQDDTLFAGSLAENIALFDDTADMHDVMDAARVASIHDDIMSMPMGYETLVGDMGSTLSGGQKQRVILARALYRKPRLLLMDEGTAHLDQDHERSINAAIRALGITRIIIAHRRETIAAADRIITLVAGRLGGAEPHLISHESRLKQLDAD